MSRSTENKNFLKIGYTTKPADISGKKSEESRKGRGGGRVMVRGRGCGFYERGCYGEKKIENAKGEVRR